MSTVGVASSHSMTASSGLPGAGFTDRLLIVASLHIQKISIVREKCVRPKPSLPGCENAVVGRLGNQPHQP